ncbi:HepT-like ribonuclease domain-containing protein [Pyrobaculum aerophilum]
MRRKIRFRDIVVHQYGNIDVEKVRRFSKPAGIEK